MIVKRDDGWYVISESHKDKDGNPKNLGGPYKTEDEAKQRLKQVEGFKNMSAEEFEAALGKEHSAAIAISNLKIAFPQLTLDEDPEKALVQIKEMFASGGDIEAEIFSVGKWNNDEYTLDDLNDIARNFSLLADEIKPPIKLGHSEEGLNKIVTDGQPAYGWVKSLRVVGEKLMATFTNVPEILKRAIKDKRYKRVSSEIYWNLKKKSGEVYKRVLGAVALLGADAPAVTNLADLEALFTQSTAKAGSFERKAIYSFVTEDGEHITEERRKDMPLTEEEKQELESLRAEKVQLSAALDTANKSAIQIRKDRAADRMRSYCETQVKSGAMQPSTRDAIMKGIKEGKYTYSDEGDGTYSIPFDMFRTVYDVRKPGMSAGKVTFGDQRGRTDIDDLEDEFAELDETPETRDYSDQSLAGTNAGLIVDREVRKYCSKHKVDYSSGLKAVLQEKPRLARAYVEATPIVRSEQHAAQSADVDAED